jgi:FkbM family methyltransferase
MPNSSPTATEQLGLTAAFLKCASAYNFRCRKIGLPMVTWLMKANLRKHGFPVYLRVGTDDYMILKQIFVEDEYAPLRDLPEPKCIVDCGGSVGFSSLYFARAYPSARIIAIEPAECNSSVFLQNLSEYGNRVQLIKSAVWSHPARLIIRNAPITNLATISVREARADEREDLMSIDIPTILDRFKLAAIDLLKIDIEGAESELFEEPLCHTWLPRVRNIAIELHNETAKSRFFAAMQQYRCETIESGELTICRNIASKHFGRNKAQ